MEKTGDNIQAKNASWTFGGDVCDKFDEHVAKSVPLYAIGHDLVLKISDFFVNDASTCYELGCSTGTLTHALATRNAHKKARFIGIDVEEPMINKAKELCKECKSVTLKTTDVLDIEFEKSDLIVAYYTVQFVKPKNRQLLRRCRDRQPDGRGDFENVGSLGLGDALERYEQCRRPSVLHWSLS